MIATQGMPGKDAESSPLQHSHPSAPPQPPLLTDTPYDYNCMYLFNDTINGVDYKVSIITTTGEGVGRSVQFSSSHITTLESNLTGLAPLNVTSLEAPSKSGRGPGTYVTVAG